MCVASVLIQPLLFPNLRSFLGGGDGYGTHSDPLDAVELRLWLRNRIPNRLGPSHWNPDDWRPDRWHHRNPYRSASLQNHYS